MPQHQGATPVQLHYGNWCSEAVLWTPWRHRGKMRAKQDTQLAAVIASKFREVLTREYQDMPFPKVYGGAFAKSLNDILKRDGPAGANLSDVVDVVLTDKAVSIA